MNQTTTTNGAENMTKQQSAVLNTKEAMTIILSEAKKVVAQKANTTIEMVEAAIIAKNEKVLGMMKELVSLAVNQVASSVA